ncbi:MAG: nitrile hydratase subunit beta [Pseudomonadota bacterium]
MNGIHDMGGMHGFGAIPIELDEPVFHTEWEARALAITVLMAAWRRWNLDRSRFAREEIPPASYLALTYYERWITALVALMRETDLLGDAELASGHAQERKTPPLSAADVRRVIMAGGPVDRQIDASPAFAPGDAVVTSNDHPAGHTRLPRYARGRRGTIVRHHGAHVFPDSNAAGNGEQPNHVYAVRFTAAELWGADGHAGDTVTLDLWENYMQPAEETPGNG